MASFNEFFPEDVPGVEAGASYNAGDIVMFGDNFYGATASVTLSDPVVASDFNTGWVLLSSGGTMNNTADMHLPYYNFSNDSFDSSVVSQTAGVQTVIPSTGIILGTSRRSAATTIARMFRNTARSGWFVQIGASGPNVGTLLVIEPSGVGPGDAYLAPVTFRLNSQQVYVGGGLSADANEEAFAAYASASVTAGGGTVSSNGTFTPALSPMYGYSGTQVASTTFTSTTDTVNNSYTLVVTGSHSDNPFAVGDLVWGVVPGSFPNAGRTTPVMIITSVDINAGANTISMDGIPYNNRAATDGLSGVNVTSGRLYRIPASDLSTLPTTAAQVDAPLTVTRDLTVNGEINSGVEMSPSVYIESAGTGAGHEGAYKFRVVGNGEGGVAGYITFELE